MPMRFCCAVCVSLALLASSAFAQATVVAPDESESLPDLSAWTLNIGFGFGSVSTGSADSSLFTVNFGFTILSGVQWTSESYGLYTEGTIRAHSAVPIYGVGLDFEFGFIDGGDLFSLGIPIDYVVTIDMEGDSAWPAITLGGRFGYSGATFDVEVNVPSFGFTNFEEATMDFIFIEPVIGGRLFTAFGIVSLEAFVRIGITVSSEFPANMLDPEDPSSATTYGLRFYAAFGF